MPIRAIFAAVLVAICWGGNFSAARFTMMDMPPLLTVLLRFIGVTILLAPFALRLKFPRMRGMLILSLSLIVVQFGLIFVAMHLGLSITSVIIATQLGTPFSCVMAAVVFKDYLGPWRSAGLMIAFLGVMIVAGTPNAASHGVAFLLAVTGAFAWAAANIQIKRMEKLPVVAMLFWPALFSLLPLALLSALTEQGQWQAIQQAHNIAWAGLAYSAIFSSLVGYGLWNWLLGKYPMSQVVPYSLLVPIFGISFGMLIFGETVSARSLLGAALTIIGVGIITVRRPSLAEAEKQ